MSQAKKHSIEEVISFGEQLIKTGDLDPVYIGLFNAVLPKDQLARLLISYLCFYHLGASAQLSEWGGADFWDLMENAASNEIPPNMNGDLPGERWPRGAERRHFRGLKCIDAVVWLRGKARKRPEELIYGLIDSSSKLTLSGVMAYIQEWPLFGDWVSFKAADIIERVMGVPIEFPSDLTLFYVEPRAALDMLDIPAEEANVKLLKHFAAFKAPPRFDRPCGIAELETCACKTRSFWHQKYWLGKDIHEVRKGLIGWGGTADRIRRGMPPEVGEGLFV